MPKDLPIRVKSPASVKSRRESSTSNPATPIVPDRASIQSYIKSIMYTFGDSRAPMDSTAELIEKLLVSQLNLVYNFASENCLKRGCPKVSVVDIVFVYRKDVALLHRLHRRLNAKRQAAKLNQTLQGVAGMGQSMGMESGEVLHQLRESFEILQDDRISRVLDDAYLDVITQERLSRADSRTREMDQQQYLEYHEARGVSFVSSNSSRKAFTEWLQQSVVSQWQVTPQAVDLLALLAYEVIAKITEAAVTVRNTAKATTEEELQQISSGRQYNPDFATNNPLLRSKLKEEPFNDQLTEGEGLDTKDVYEALRRMQEANEPIISNHCRDTTPRLWII